jgi:catecholate siderophore receptor
MSSRQALRLCCLLSVFFLASSSSFAQQTEPLVKGKVLDPNHAAVSGAEILAIADSNGLKRTASTNQNGEFAVALVTGKYHLRVTAPGFVEVSVPLDVTTNPAPVEVALEVAGSVASVTITDTGGYQIAAISSATKTPTSLRDIPQAISVVTREQIQDRSLDSIAAAVTYVPGVTSHQGENNRDQLIMRGNSTSADFFVNGVRDDVQYYRDFYNVERLEALKGPNAMIFGRGGGGGVLNRVTKEAKFTSSREFIVQGGSFHDKRFTTDLNQKLSDKVALRFNGLYERSGSFRDFVHLERYGVSPTATFAISPNTSARIAFEHFHDSRVADRGIPSYLGKPVDIPISTYFGNPNDSHVRAGVNLLSASLDHQAGKLGIHNRTMFGDYDRFYQNYVPGAVTADKSKVALTTYNNATKRQNLFNQTDLNYFFNTGNVKHNLLGGVELGRQVTDNFRNTGFFNNTATSIQVSLANPVISTPVTFRQNATDANNHLQVNLGAAYIQDQIDLTRRVQVITGVRFDYFDLRYHSNRTGEELRRIDHLVSPRVGLVVKPVTELSLYGSYSVSYLPSSGDQFSSLTTITQQVKPERFDNFEVGAKWDVRRNLTLTTALYRLDRTNTRATDPNDPTKIVQTGSQRTNGFELGANGSITKDWRVSGGYAFQDAFISSATTAAPLGAKVAQVPRHTFSLWNHYQIIPKLGAGVGIVRRSDMFAAIDDKVVLPGYTRIDAAVYYSLSEKWRFQLNMENLFNRQYYINADNNNNISPGRPRGARLGLVARF